MKLRILRLNIKESLQSKQFFLKEEFNTLEFEIFKTRLSSSTLVQTCLTLEDRKTE